MTEPQPTTLDYAAPESASRINWRDELGLLVVYILLFVGLWLASPYFLSVRNLRNILQAVSTIGIISIPMTMVIVAGGIDLSVGSVVAVVGVIIAQVSHQAPVPVVLLAAILVGALVGVLNGAAITYGRINPFITTLGTLSIARGIAIHFSSGLTQSIDDEAFLAIGRGHFLGIPFPAITMIALFVLAAWVMRWTVFGRNTYAVGGNPQASRLAGIPVARVQMTVYILSGISAAVGAIFATAQLGAAAPKAAEGLELSVIAAVILGGTNLAGGKGSIWGTLLGVLIMGTLNNGLTLLNVKSEMQDVARGTVLLLAVGLDQLRLRWARE
jgi:ribose transport system permease protein